MNNETILIFVIFTSLKYPINLTNFFNSKKHFFKKNIELFHTNLPSNSSWSTFRAATNISRHFNLTASVVFVLGGGNCVGSFLSFSLSFSSRAFSDFSFLSFEELLLDSFELFVFEPDTNFFQFFISVFDKLTTSSSVLDFLKAFTVIPIRVLVKTSKSICIFCSSFSKSRACS